MPPGPKPIPLVLSATERETLLGLLRRRSTSQEVASRARDAEREVSPARRRVAGRAQG